MSVLSRLNIFINAIAVDVKRALQTSSPHGLLALLRSNLHLPLARIHRRSNPLHLPRRLLPAHTIQRVECVRAVRREVECVKRCCVLVVQMKTALLEILGAFATVRDASIFSSSDALIYPEKFTPDRIIIECSYVSASLPIPFSY